MQEIVIIIDKLPTVQQYIFMQLLYVGVLPEGLGPKGSEPLLQPVAGGPVVVPVHNVKVVSLPLPVYI